MRRRGSQDDDSNALPGWVTTFSDMITLLLTFFVLLQAFAKTRSPELFYEGQGSFVRAINHFGLPDWVFGQTPKPSRDFRELKYPTKPADNPIPRNHVLDAEDEEIRQSFHELQQEIRTRTSNQTPTPLNVRPTPLRFAPGRADLDAAGRQWVDSFAMNLKQNLQNDDVTIYVIARTPAAPAEKGAMLLAARRAGAVGQAMREALETVQAPRRWEVRSWASGAAQNARGTPAIVIAVMGGGPNSHG